MLSVRRANLRPILAAMRRPSTFYVLGAGTSAGLVPFTASTLDTIRQSYLEGGVFSIDSEPSPLKDRVIMAATADRCRRGEWDLDDDLLERAPHSAIELVAQKAWTAPLASAPPPQYSLLARVAAPALFLSFNLDGFAKAYLGGRHRILEPHGTIDRRWTEHPEFDDLLTLSLDIQLPSLAPKLLPGPEPPEITKTAPFAIARRHLSRATSVIIIGYSFGRFRERMDDSESFEFLTDFLRNRPLTIFIVDPNAEQCASSFEERLHRKCVVSLPLRWDEFSTLVTDTAKSGCGLEALMDNDSLDSLVNKYYRNLCEKGLTN